MYTVIAIAWDFPDYCSQTTVVMIAITLSQDCNELLFKQRNDTHSSSVVFEQQNFAISTNVLSTVFLSSLQINMLLTVKIYPWHSHAVLPLLVQCGKIILNDWSILFNIGREKVK